MNFTEFYSSAAAGSLRIFIEEMQDIPFETLLSSASALEEEYFYWHKPEAAMRFIGLQRFIEVTADGKTRSDLCDEQVQQLLQNIVCNLQDSAVPRDLPILMGAMSFAYGQKDEVWEDFHDADWFIPRIMYLEMRGRFLCVSFFTDEPAEEAEDEPAEEAEKLYLQSKERLQRAGTFSPPGSLPRIEPDIQGEFSDWAEKVDTILEDIHSGSLSKVVLSRMIRYRLSHSADPSRLMSQLALRYPGCYIFAYKKGSSLFFGASPEKLAALHDGLIEADALAGSMPRGSDENEDERLGKALLSSKKNLAEQKAVVHFILDSFAEFTCTLQAPRYPVLRKLPNIQHLWTPVQGELCPGFSVLKILGRIHPTPAICGVPWKRARKRILQIEDYSRGLYSGLLGWFGVGYEGEFAVAIRSALMKQRSLYVFAGCGIVEGSDPLSEYQESELKLKPMTRLFTDPEERPEVSSAKDRKSSL